MAKAIVNYVGDLIEGEGEEPETEAAAPDFALKVEGMMCGNCEAKVQKALEAVAGVVSAEVDWEAGSATVYGAADGAALVDAVECTGKDAWLLRTTSLAVEGMMCGNCEAKVRKALEAVSGVVSAEVDWEAGTAAVYGTAPEAELVDAVECTGKDCKVAPPQTETTLAIEGMM